MQFTKAEQSGFLTFILAFLTGTGLSAWLAGTGDWMGVLASFIAGAVAGFTAYATAAGIPVGNATGAT